MKERFRHLVYKLMGYPSDVQNLLNYIDEVGDHICIYKAGEFPFGIVTPDGTPTQPFIFPTMQERAAFSAGMKHSINLMGGQAGYLSDGDMNQLDEMDKIASHKGDPTKVN